MSWDEYISYLYAASFMNNARYDSHDRKKLFNFQFPRHLELTPGVYLSKYDYMKLPEGVGDQAANQEDNDVISNPDDDISDDGFVMQKRPLNDKDLEELEELDDILADNDPYTISLPTKRTADSVERQQYQNVTQEDLADLDDLMDEYLGVEK